MIKIIIACIVLGFTSTSFASYDIGSMDKNFAYVDQIYGKLFDTGKISKAEWESLVSKAHTEIYDIGKNPEEVYNSARAYEQKQLDSSNSTSNKDYYYGLTKEIYYKLFNNGYITQSEYESQRSVAWDYIYKADSIPEKIYNSALSYEKEKTNTTNGDLKNDVYGKIKNGLYALETKGYLNKQEVDELLTAYYADIFTNLKNPNDVYNNFLTLEKQQLNRDAESLKKETYGKIKNGLGELLNQGIIDKTQYNSYIEYYYSNVFTYPQEPNSVYKDYTELRKNLVQSNIDNQTTKRDVGNDTNTNTKSVTREVKSSLPQSTQDLITRKIESIDFSKREQWISNVIDKIDILLTKKSWSTKNRNTLSAIQQLLQNHLNENSSELNVNTLLN